MRPAIRVVALLCLAALGSAASADPSRPTTANDAGRTSVWTGGIGWFAGTLEPSHGGGARYNEDGGFGPALRLFVGREISPQLQLVASADVQVSFEPDLFGSGSGVSNGALLAVGVERRYPVGGGSWVLSAGAGYALLHLDTKNADSDPEPCSGGSPFVPCFAPTPAIGGTGGGYGYRIALGWQGRKDRRWEAAVTELRTDGAWLPDGGEVSTRVLQLGRVVTFR